jgi:hypothetical protein
MLAVGKREAAGIMPAASLLIKNILSVNSVLALSETEGLSVVRFIV